jgi:membrane protease YdiL (CAAX protease family)
MRTFERRFLTIMDSYPSPISASARISRVGVVIRVSFYAAVALAGISIIPVLLTPVLGVVVPATVGLFGVAVLTNFLTLKIFDRRALTDIGLGGGRGTGRNFALGLVLGGGAAALMLLAPLLAGAARLDIRAGGQFAWSSLLFYLVVLLFGAAGEEILFRGYAFQLLIEKLGPWATVLPMGVLFGFAHGSNPHATTLGMLNTALWGIYLGYAFLRSHDLWLPIGLHYGWNFVLPLFGVNLSGLTIEVTRYSYRWDLGPIWSGGRYGPEGGVLTTIFVAILLYAMHRVPVVPQPAHIAESLNEME